MMLVAPIIFRQISVSSTSKLKCKTNIQRKKFSLHLFYLMTV